eukprot:TRINITY_DN5120_c1_g1_i1.p1 TRINITY_DN5120_c1_g1~~TRINITY_DN5120_c1_g1_i1.p1  ORF type:complete len:250 (+),score=80.28 TRINITY_DN5120_c1_g1_i1:86-835(+)
MAHEAYDQYGHSQPRYQRQALAPGPCATAPLRQPPPHPAYSPQPHPQPAAPWPLRPPPQQHQQQQQSYPQGPPARAAAPDLRELYAAADVERKGLGDRELMLALQKAGFGFRIEVCRLLVPMYASQGGAQTTDKRLSFEEFKSLHTYVSRHKQVFDKLGPNDTGVLSPQKVYKAISQSGYTISQECFSSIMRKLDRRKVGGLNVDGYIELSIFIHNVKDTFAFYDKRREGQVHFVFEDFTRACVNLHGS